MGILKVAHEKFARGACLNDAELTAMIELYQCIVDNLSHLGDEFKLARMEALNRLETFSCYETNRKYQRENG